MTSATNKARITKTAKPKTTPVKKIDDKVGKAAFTARTGQQNEGVEQLIDKGAKQFDKITRDAAKSGKEQTDAFVRSGTLLMKGAEDLAKICFNLAQDSAEKNAQAIKSVMGCKTVNEFTETHSKWAQQNFDDFVTGVTKVSELSVKLATDAFEPLNNQLNKNIKKASESLAV